ncbi:DUF58 domain-containing protein [bacterium]|nr:DUF58 domain-containing protein [bacterium]
MRNDPDVQRVLADYSLGVPRQTSAGRSGELLGRGTGTSLEFQEYREYLPGDDIRHLDWAAYARSDALMVRLYREEVSPRVEVLLDLSCSMTTSGAKSQLAQQLAAVFSLLSASLGGSPVVWLAADTSPPEGLTVESLHRLREVDFNAKTGLDELLRSNGVPLRRQAMRVVLSDFLFPFDPESLITRLRREASELWLVQILSDWELSPAEASGTRLIDAETAAETHLYLNRATIGEYLERLHRLQQDLQSQSVRAGARFVTLNADLGLAGACREALAPAGMLTPRA